MIGDCDPLGTAELDDASRFDPPRPPAHRTAVETDTGLDQQIAVDHEEEARPGQAEAALGSIAIEGAHDGPIWFSSGEAAHQLGITPGTLRRLVNDGSITAYRIGRVIRVRSEDLDDFLERARIRPGEIGSDDFEPGDEEQMSRTIGVRPNPPIIPPPSRPPRA